jgi:hypothetical protein
MGGGLKEPLPMPEQVSDAEANIFVVFTGWNPQVTGEMELEELMQWHEQARKRSEAK